MLPDEEVEADTITAFKKHLVKYMNRKGIEGYGSCNQATEPAHVSSDCLSMVWLPLLGAHTMPLGMEFQDFDTATVKKQQYISKSG
eukprot:g27735.t1